MSLFESFRKQPNKAELPPAQFNPEWMDKYKKVAEQDEEMKSLLTRREEITAFQNVGQGVSGDTVEKEKVEGAIAERYAQSVS